MDPTEKDLAVCLRFAPWSNTSRLILWMTREHGRVATMIKGAQRPKSFFLGQYDLFYGCELVFYAREHGGLHMVRECTPLVRRDRLRTDWRASALASYACDLLARALPSDTPAPELYALLEETLDELAEAGVADGLLSWFELQFMARMGLGPALDRCATCGRPLAEPAARPGFSLARGGLVCRPCTAASAGDAQRVAPDTLALLRAWRRAPAARAVRSTRAATRQQLDVERLLGLFLRYHLDLRLPARDAALDILRYEPTRAG